mmetsp:Transcript_9060/g.16768  ORF Transcript_9060/g.16768 Transcript_9060/m.16768 type:complete len:95 (-) Transcript_9060:235-519(-)
MNSLVVGTDYDGFEYCHCFHCDDDLSMLREAGGDSARKAREDNEQNEAVVEVVPRKDSFAAGLGLQQHILLRNDVGGVVLGMDYEETWNYSPDD